MALSYTAIPSSELDGSSGIREGNLRELRDNITTMAGSPFAVKWAKTDPNETLGEFRTSSTSVLPWPEQDFNFWVPGRATRLVFYMWGEYISGAPVTATARVQVLGVNPLITGSPFTINKGFTDITAPTGTPLELKYEFSLVSGLWDKHILLRLWLWISTGTGT